MAQKDLRWSKIEVCSRVYQSVSESGKKKLALKGFKLPKINP